VARLRGAEAGLFETGFVAGASHRPYFVTRPVAQWLERELGFPVWSADDIASMPETHISQWARSEGVAMDPLYATEHREGGARALGSGVPGIGRHQLNVFSPDEWRRRKRTLIYERWIEEARSALSVPQKR
jgi:hypothetical protein